MIKEEVSYYLGSDFGDERKQFKTLCIKYKKEYKIPQERDNTNDKIGSKEPLMTEEEFIKKINKTTKKSTLETLYQKLINYDNNITLSKVEPWEVLISKTVKICGNVNYFTDLLQETMSMKSNIKFGIATALKNPTAKKEMINYLSSTEITKYSGQSK